MYRAYDRHLYERPAATPAAEIVPLVGELWVWEARVSASSVSVRNLKATLVNEWAEALTTALRKSGIDKLPHLINVLRGDMSLVGPELVGAQQALHYGPEGPELLLARPGVVSVRRYARHILRPSTAEMGPERLYILRWSLWLDLRILCGALARIHATDANRPAK